jgi:hypothetical protein
VAWALGTLLLSVTITSGVTASPAAAAHRPCPLGSRWDPNAAECLPYNQQCPDGRVYNGTTCVDIPAPPAPAPTPPGPPPGSRCPVGQFWNPNAGECFDYSQQCPPDEVYDGRACVLMPALSPPLARFGAAALGLTARADGDVIEPSGTDPVLTQSVGKLSFNGCDSPTGDPRNRAWRIVNWYWRVVDGETTQFYGGDAGSCQIYLDRPLTASWGTWTVTLTVRRSDGRLSEPETHIVRYRDLVIASLGDSAASGEGVPDVSTSNCSVLEFELGRCHDKPRWAAGDGAQCDRSGWAASAQGALRAQKNLTSGRRDPGTGSLIDSLTSVTFWHLACSGASIADPSPAEFSGSGMTDSQIAAAAYGNGGLLTPYHGENQLPGTPCNPYKTPPITTGCTPALHPQVDQLKTLIASSGRQPDVLLITAGANDTKWSDFVKLCYPLPLGVSDTTCLSDAYTGPVLRRLHCYLMPDSFCAGYGGLPESPDRFGQLALALRAMSINPSSVFLTEYWDATRDDRSGFLGGPYAWWCPNDILAPGSFARRWGHENVVVPLNAKIDQAAAANGWNLIPIAKIFDGHGLCSTDTWIVSPTESIRHENSTNGSWHANQNGQNAIADQIYARLRRNSELRCSLQVG